MPIEWVALAASGAIRAVVSATVSGLGRAAKKKLDNLLSEGPLEAPLRKAFTEAFTGFYKSLEANLDLEFTYSNEQALNELPEKDSFCAVVRQLPYMPFRKIEVEPLRVDFLNIGIEGAEEDVFNDAWQALGRRFERAVANDEELKSFVDLQHSVRQEDREEKLLALVERLVHAQEAATKGPELGPALQKYCEALYRQYRYAGTRGLFMRHTEIVGERIELQEVFVETLLSQVSEKPDNEELDSVRFLESRGKEKEPIGKEPDTSLGPLSNVAASIGEVLQRERAIVVLGAPGCGKSTLLRSLCLTLCRPASTQPLVSLDLGAKMVPILLPLKEFASELQNRPNLELSRYILEHFGARLPKLEELLAEGQVLVLLDGLDEVFNDADLQWVSKECWHFISEYPATRVVLTSRTHGYRAAPLLGPVPCWELLHFNDHQIESFFRGWFKALARVGSLSEMSPAQRAALLTSDVLSQPKLREMATNPLLCTLIVLVHRSRSGQLPERRVIFYEAAIRTLAEVWERGKHSPRQYNFETIVPEPEILIRALAEIAWRATYQLSTSEIPAGILREWLLEYLKREPSWQGQQNMRAVRELLRLIVERTGLLLELSADRYQFVHLSIHEWLVSYFLRDRLTEEQRRSVVRNYLHAPEWSEILTLLLAGATYAQAEQLVTDLLENPTGDWEKFLRRDLRFLLRCLADQVPIGPDARRRLIDATLKGLDDPELIDLAGFIADMAGIGQLPELIPPLLERISVSEKIRQAIVELLSQVRGNPAIGQLMLRELSSRNSEVRCAAIRYFAKYEPDNLEARAAIITKLSDKHWLVREAASDFFAFIGRDDTTWGVAANQLLDESYYYDRLAAVKYFTLVGAKDDATRDVVLRAMGSGNADLRAAAVRYLVRFGPDSPYLKHAVLQRLRFREWQQRLSAVEFFVQIGDPDEVVRQEMLERLKDEEEWYVRLAIVGFFVRFGIDPATRKFIDARLKSPDWRVRQEAIGFLSEVVIDSETREIILKELNDEEWRARRAAVEFFSRVRDASSGTKSAMLKALSDSDWRVRQAAVGYYTGIKCRDSTVRECILECLDDDEPLVRRAAMEFLSTVERESVTVRDAIFGRLDDEDATVRLAAIEFFARVNLDARDIERLVPKLLDEKKRGDWRVLQAAVELLLRIGSGDLPTRHFFYQRLSDGHNPIRRLAMEYFWRLAAEEDSIQEEFLQRLSDVSSLPHQLAGWRFFLRAGFDALQGRRLIEVFEVISNETGVDERRLFSRLLGKLAAAEEGLKAIVLEKGRKLSNLDFGAVLEALASEEDRVRREGSSLDLPV